MNQDGSINMPTAIKNIMFQLNLDPSGCIQAWRNIWGKMDSYMACQMLVIMHTLFLWTGPSSSMRDKAAVAPSIQNLLKILKSTYKDRVWKNFQSLRKSRLKLKNPRYNGESWASKLDYLHRFYLSIV